MKICIIGPANPYRGGIATFNERMARQLQAEGHDVVLETFTLQYPKILFPGKTQFTDTPKPTDLCIRQSINSINPFNWWNVGNRLAHESYDLVVCRYWLSFLAPALGFIARRIRRNRTTKLSAFIDNLMPHERHFWDRPMAKYFLKPFHEAVVMSRSVEADVHAIQASMPTKLTRHPIFDTFGNPVNRVEAARKLDLDPACHYFLFFGFIRAYKGLDWLLEAFADARLRDPYLKLIVAGEFYEEEKPYHDLVQKLGLENAVIWHTRFIPDRDVSAYFALTDLLVQPYKDATQSGVTQIAYHFLKPMLVTNVGGLSEMIPDGRCGYVVKPTISAIADAMVHFREAKNPDLFRSGLIAERELYSWDRLTHVLLDA